MRHRRRRPRPGRGVGRFRSTSCGRSGGSHHARNRTAQTRPWPPRISGRGGSTGTGTPGGPAHSRPAATTRAPCRREPGAPRRCERRRADEPHPLDSRRMFLVAPTARLLPASRWTWSFIASSRFSGGGGVRSARACASSSPSSTRRPRCRRPSRALASSNARDIKRSKGACPADTMSSAARLLLASPRSACRTMSSTLRRCCSFAAFIALPLAQKCTLRRDTPKSCPSCSHVNPEMRRNSETARLVTTDAAAVTRSVSAGAVQESPPAVRWPSHVNGSGHTPMEAVDEVPSASGCQAAMMTAMGVSDPRSPYPVDALVSAPRRGAREALEEYCRFTTLLRSGDGIRR